jgi:hypothetical protein
MDQATETGLFDGATDSSAAPLPSFANGNAASG